jgi:hypothetical protein
LFLKEQESNLLIKKRVGMFRFIKRLIFLVLLMGIVAWVASVFLPKTYEAESSILIRASKPQIFAQATQLESWNLLSIYGEFPTDFELPDKPVSGADPLIDSLVSSVRQHAETMKVRCRITVSEEPDRIVFEAEGGPVHGLQAEIVLVKHDQEFTRVTMNERLRFEGFFGSLKALAARHGGIRLQERSLQNLKKQCEGM